MEKGEKLILPKGVAHWQGHEDGLLYEYAYVAEHQAGGQYIRIAEHFKDIRGFKLEMGMGFKLAPYQDWTARLKQRQRAIRGPSQECIDFDIMCHMYFRFKKGMGSEIDGSQGLFDLYKEEQQAFPPFGPD